MHSEVQIEELDNKEILDYLNSKNITPINLILSIQKKWLDIVSFIKLII